MKGQFGLFGTFEKIPEKTFEEEYKEYIASAQWARIREAKIANVGGKCEKCGASKWSARLDVHHKHYRTFKHERMEDLEVLCYPVCHASADNQRHYETEQNKKHKAIYKGFETWMDNGNNGEKWRDWNNYKLSGEWERFLDYLSNITKRERYNIPFWRNPEW